MKDVGNPKRLASPLRQERRSPDLSSVALRVFRVSGRQLAYPKFPSAITSHHKNI